MKIHQDDPLHSVNACLADYLSERKEVILGEWLGSVRRDAAILPSKSLNKYALTNHLPEIVDDLTATLRHYGSEMVAENSVKTAGEHGATRWMQGYELPEVLREIKHLRALLIYHLRMFEDLNPDNGMAALLFVSSTLHGFLDEIAVDATREFLWSQLSPQDKVRRRQTEWENDRTNQSVFRHAAIRIDEAC
jgi:hypothetical protein